MGTNRDNLYIYEKFVYEKDVFYGLQAILMPMTNVHMIRIGDLICMDRGFEQVQTDMYICLCACITFGFMFTECFGAQEVDILFFE